MLACMTGLRRWVPTVNLDQGSSVPFSFVLQLPDELTPTNITDSLGQCGVLDHVLNCQALDTHHLVFVDDAGTQLVLVVSSSVIDPCMDFGNFETSFGSVLRAFLFLSMPTLGLCQSLLILGKIARVAYAFSGGECDHGFDTEIESNHFVHHWQRFDLVLYQNGHEVAVGTIFGDRDRTRFGTFWKVSVPMDIQGSIHLGKSQHRAIPLERIGGIGSRLIMPLFLERRVLGSTLKEIDKRPLQMPQSLLDGNGRDLHKPRIPLLELGEHGSKIVVVEALPMLEIGRLTDRESPIVDKADTAERLSQNAFLFIGRIEPEFVGPPSLLAHGLFTFLLLFYMLLNRVDDLAISRSLVLLGGFLEALQKSWINVNRKALCLHTGNISLFYLCAKGTWYTTLPKSRNKKRPLYPHS